MISSSTFEAGCIGTRIGSVACLTVWSGIRYLSSKILVSFPISIESGSVKVHWHGDIIHASWSIGWIVLWIVWPYRVVPGLVSLVIIPHIASRSIIVLESSTLKVIVSLETSKYSSSESQRRNEGRSVGLSGLVSLRVLLKDILQKLLCPSGLNCSFLSCGVVYHLGSF